MRKVAHVVTFLGALLLVVGLFAVFVIPGALLKVPLNVDQETRLAGHATLGDESFDAKVFSFTRIDSEHSDDKNAVWVSSQCLVKDIGDVDGCVSADDAQNRLVNAGSDVFVTDRTTAEAVPVDGYTAAVTVQHEGLVNKWPFNAEKRDYDYWDGSLGRAVVAKYVGVEDLDGLETYVYEVQIDDEPVDLTEGVPGFYSATKTITVEPMTGSPVNQHEQQTRTTEDGETFLELDVQFTEEQLKTSVDEAKANVANLKMITKTVPVVGIVGGGLLLVLGVVLHVLAGRRQAGPKKA